MTSADLTEHLISRLHEVQQRLGLDPIATPETAFADAVDSMGLVEFVGVLASDCDVAPEAIEKAAGRRFSTIADLARAMHAVRLGPGTKCQQEAIAPTIQTPDRTVWLAGWQVGIPGGRRSALETDQNLGRPPGWLTEHAGIESCWVWSENPLNVATRMVQGPLPTPAQKSSLAALLVTGEAPLRIIGQAAAFHSQFGLPAHVPALEVGGACLGFLHCVWLGRQLVRPGLPVLLLALEYPSKWLGLSPGPEGEAAAPFGDALGMSLLCAEEPADAALSIRDVILGCDGSGGDLVQVRLMNPGDVEIHMDGPSLALQAVRSLAGVVREICERHALKVDDLETVYIHAGNGRMPALVARQLGLPDERIISTTSHSGNLGSVSLPAALCYRPPTRGPVVLAAVGAGLCWGAALLG